MNRTRLHWKRGIGLLVPLVVFAALLVHLNGAAGKERDAADIWQKSLTLGAETPMRADMTLIQRVPGKTLTTRARLVQGAGGKYRVEYTEPAAMKGRVLVSDGQGFRQFDAKTNAVTELAQVSGTGQGGRKTDPLIPGSHKITLLSDHEIIGGRTACLLEITPFRADLSRQRRWIDCATFKALRVETRFPDGKLSRDVAYSHVQIPAKSAASDFQIAARPGLRVISAIPSAAASPPQNAAVRAAQFGFAVNAPLGFRLMQTTESAVGGKRNSQFLYSNGIETISLFAQDGGAIPQGVPAGWQRLVLHGVPVFEQRTGHTDALVWQRGGHRFTALARLAPDALQAFVAGVMK